MQPVIRRLLGLLILFSSATAVAQVGFSPQYYDLTSAEAQGTHAYRLFNLTKDPKQVKVSVVSWDFDERGEIRILPSSDATLDQWVVVNPVEFTIPPGDSQAVRFSIRPAVELSPGEHRAMLVFDEVLQPQSAAQASGPGAQTALRARFQFRTAIYYQSGTATRTAELTAVKVDATNLTLQTRATGSANTRFDGQFMIWKASAFPGLDKVSLLGNLADPNPALPHGMVAAGRLPGQPVLPGETRTYEVSLGNALQKGAYIAVLPRQRDQYREDGDWERYTRGFMAHLHEQRCDCRAGGAGQCGACGAALLRGGFNRCHRTYVARAVAKLTGARVCHITVAGLVLDAPDTSQMEQLRLARDPGRYVIEARGIRRQSRRLECAYPPESNPCALPPHEALLGSLQCRQFHYLCGGAARPARRIPGSGDRSPAGALADPGSWRALQDAS